MSTEALNDPNDPMHGRARFTLAHELGHLVLHEGPALHPTNSDDQT